MFEMVFINYRVLVLSMWMRCSLRAGESALALESCGGKNGLTMFKCPCIGFGKLWR